MSGSRSRRSDTAKCSKFNTCRFADFKEKVIDLLARVTTVSVRTQAIWDAMKLTPR